MEELLILLLNIASTHNLQLQTLNYNPKGTCQNILMITEIVLS